MTIGPKLPGKSPVAENHKPILKPNQANMTDFRPLASTNRLTKKELRTRKRNIELRLELMKLDESDPEDSENAMGTKSPEPQP